MVPQFPCQQVKPFCPAPPNMRFLKNFFYKPPSGIALLAGFLLFLPAHAEASMVFCNRTQNPIEAAVGYRAAIDWVSEGWWRIEPDQCSRVIGQALTQRFYFYYAKSLGQPGKNKSNFIWGGKYQFCVDAKAFKFEGDGDCESKGFITKGFNEIDIGSRAKDYSLDFKDGSERR